jgi:Rieske Fe-S protein
MDNERRDRHAERPAAGPPAVWTRRRFFLAAAAGTAGLVWAGCDGSEGAGDVVTQIARAQTKRPEVLVRLSGSEEFTRDGASRSVPATAEAPPLLLVRHGGAVVAYVNMCTHSACPLQMAEDARAILCNPECGHGSVYSVGGEVVRGPSTRPLLRLPARFDAASATVRVNLHSLR